MKKILLEDQLNRMFELINHNNSREINENVVTSAFPNELSCVASFPQVKGSQGTIQGGTANVQKYGVVYAEPKGIKELEGVSFSNTGQVFKYGYEKGTFSCQGSTINYKVDGKNFTYTPKSTSDVKVLPTVTIVAPPKFLKNTEGVKAFQDWLDTYKKGWYKGGQLNKGGGYGRFGPNTTKAWNSHKDEYMNQKTPQIKKITGTTTTQITNPVLTNPVLTGNLNIPITPTLNKPNISGDQLYKLLYDGGNVEGAGKDRIKVKSGIPIENESLLKLDEYLSTLDYKRIKQDTEKNYGSKYVWEKIK